MEFLLYLQQFRNETLNSVAMFITHLGEETVVMAVLCLFYWCVNKKNALRIAFTYFVAGMLTQILKIIFMIERPWVSGVINPPAEAKAGATGYSFPSGHTQGATSLYGNLAYILSRPILKILMVVLFLAVGFSRMYLGVHTPLDVSVSMCLSLLVVIIINYAVDSRYVYRFKREQISALMTGIVLIMFVYGIIRLCTNTIDMANLKDYIKACGAAFGFAGGWYLEGKYLNFDEKSGTVLQKVIRLVAGLALMLGLKVGINYILSAVAASFLNNYAGKILVWILTYGVVVFFAIYLYPLIFSKLLSKVEGKQ